MESLDAIKRILKRERQARKAAEVIIEQKSRELFSLNQQLIQLNSSLEEQVTIRTQELEEKNNSLKDIQAQLEIKVQQLKDSNRYKSEFLANMSHELRTPLNSILILARMLSENREGNFTSKQIEYSQVIHNSGQDLLTLINQILDLAKIEAGRVDVQEEETTLLEIKNNIEDLFFEIARKKSIDFTIQIGEGIPKKIWIDKLKVLQILRNLVSNAFKFTEMGGKVTVNIQRRLAALHENSSVDYLEFSVKDTGIGIVAEKLELIFEAFQQADGSTSRRYGGTGLGLSICKELTSLMQGYIRVKSELGKGSQFLVALPLKYIQTTEVSQNDVVQYVAAVAPEEIPDDRHDLLSIEKPILIIEDDIRFAKILRDYAHSKGHKVIIATQGDRGLHYVREFNPRAVFLDIQLPVVDGWSVLKEIKLDNRISSIPVHIFSVIDKQKLGIDMGASSYNVKPITMGDLESIFGKIKDSGHSSSECLIIGNDSRKFPLYYQSVQRFFSNIRYVKEEEEALRLIKETPFKLVMAIGSPTQTIDCPAFLQRMDEASSSFSNMIYYYCLDANPLGKEEKKREYQHICLLSTPEELYKKLGIVIPHETQVTSSAPQSAAPIATPQEQACNTAHEENKLYGRNILLVDDEMRNIFALDSVLDPYEANIIIANNGQQALEQLAQNPDIELVLMDIMMPIMDGYEAMRNIRQNPRFKDLPIIALTAKAMVGDREKCIAAGATDYVSKPIDVDQLLEIMCSLL